MIDRTQNGVTHIAGMNFDENQMTVLRAYFKEEWQREEVRNAIGVIMEVLASHDDGQPDNKLDQQISLLLLHGSIQNDIVERFYSKVPGWNEEALQEANDHGVGVWRSLYDIIVPEMRAKLKPEDANARTHQVNGKTYTEAEVVAIYNMWQAIQDYNAISESVDLALEMIGNPDVAEYARKNDPEIMERCLESLSDWRGWQDELLSQHSLLLHYLVKDKLKEMYEKRRKEQDQK